MKNGFVYGNMYDFSNIKLYFAPLEGITYPQYRQVHASIFGGADIYYSPFIPTGNYDTKFLLKHFPDKDNGITLVPQLIANNPDKFTETAKAISDFGYDEINLNAGCPSATVFSKYKGSGMLRDLDTLDTLLEKIFISASVNISVKTRLGVSSVSEFDDILPIYNKYNISLLTIHARDRAGMYSSEVNVQSFVSAYSMSSNPVCYNGDIFSCDDLSELANIVPDIKHVMIGRGAIANPAIFRIIRGGNPLKRSELAEFNDSLIESYLKSGLSPAFTAERVKTLWPYMSCMFPNSHRELKIIKKAHGLDNFKSAVNSLINNCEFNGTASFRPF